MRKTFETVLTIGSVALLYTAPFLMAFYSLVMPTYYAEEGPVPREARFLLAQVDLVLESGEEGPTARDEAAQDEAAGEKLSVDASTPKPVSRDSSTQKSHSSAQAPAATHPSMASKSRLAGAALGRTMLTGVSGRVSGAPSTKKKHKKRRRRRPKCLEGTESITEIGNNRYAVERALIDSYARDLRALGALAWVSWHEDDAGKVDGFVVRRIRCGSVLHEAGIRNGDVVHAVNGRRIRSMAKAIPLWWALRKRPIVHLRITRGDESMRLFYRLS
jgi:hypothetical protein